MSSEVESPSGDFSKESYALVTTDFTRTKKGETRAYYQFIGIPTDESYELGNAAEYETVCESGDCWSCGIEVSSVSKRAICPFCGEEVGLT